MDNSGQPEESPSTPNDTPSESSYSHKSSYAPKGQQITNNYIERAKKFSSNYVARPVNAVVVWIDKHNGLVTALSTVAIAVLTYFVAIYANSQLGVFRSQLEEMRATGSQTDALIETNKKLAEAASIQAQAAKDAASTAHENLVASQRAWIAPIQFSFVDLNNAQQPLRVKMMYQNVGREPARNVRNYLFAGYIRDPVPPEPKYWGKNPTWFVSEDIKPQVMCDKVTANNRSVIYPSPTAGFSLEISADNNPFIVSNTQILFDEVKNKKSIYFVAGCLSYETLKDRRNSTFCAMLTPVDGKEIAQWQFSSCPVGNEDF